MLIYLDTIAWNTLCDSAEPAAVEALDSSEVLFSSCNLDEFSLAGSERAQQLAAFALRVSNGRKLHDHLELAAAEIRARQTQSEPSGLYDDNPKFLAAWRYASEHGVPAPVQSAVRQAMESVKRDYRTHLREARDLFRPVFERFAEVGIKQAWPEILGEMDDDGSLMAWVIALVEQVGLIESIPDRQGAHQISCLSLPATAGVAPPSRTVHVCRSSRFGTPLPLVVERRQLA